jgi:hypothetical protein
MNKQGKMYRFEKKRRKDKSGNGTDMVVHANEKDFCRRFYALTSTGVTFDSRNDLVVVSQCQVCSPHEFLAFLLQVRGRGTPSTGLGFFQT